MQKQLVRLCGFDDAIQTLTGIYSATPVLAEKLNDWLSSVDFEAFPSGITCMAATAAAKVKFENIPTSLVPRLRGIVKYVHTLNAGMMAGLYRLAAALNGANIPMVLLEDTALYVRFSDVPQRHLWQMRVGVPRHTYTEVLELARKLGLQVEVYEFTAMAQQGNTCRINIIPLAEDAAVWNRTTEIQKANAAFACPNPGAILIGICQSAFRSLTKPSPRETLVRWIMDMNILLACLSEEDWREAVTLAQQEHAERHVCFLLAVFEALTGIPSGRAQQFGKEEDVLQLAHLLDSFNRCTNKGQKIRRSFLLFRLRRPDSIRATVQLFVRNAFKKLWH